MTDKTGDLPLNIAEICGIRRGRRSRTWCELPPDHVTGRAAGQPILELYHLGRSRMGRWYSWGPAMGRTP